MAHTVAMCQLEFCVENRQTVHFSASVMPTLQPESLAVLL